MQRAACSVGLTLALVAPLLSQVVINEVMRNPAAVPDTRGEWFELFNDSGETIDLQGWTIADAGQDLHIVEAGTTLVIDPHGFVVLGRNGDPTVNGGYQPDYVYSGFVLSNEQDEIILFRPDGSVADSIVYDAQWPRGSGVSMELVAPGYDNTLPGNWGDAIRQYGEGDYGTPGMWNSISGTGIRDVEGERPRSDALRIRPYPNPTTGGFRVEVTGPISSIGSSCVLEVYTLRGRRLRTLVTCCLKDGPTILRWDGSSEWGGNVPAGVYLLRVRAGGVAATEKVVVLR